MYSSRDRRTFTAASGAFELSLRLMGSGAGRGSMDSIARHVDSTHRAAASALAHSHALALTPTSAAALACALPSPHSFSSAAARARCIATAYTSPLVWSTATKRSAKAKDASGPTSYRRESTAPHSARISYPRWPTKPPLNSNGRASSGAHASADSESRRCDSIPSSSRVRSSTNVCGPPAAARASDRRTVRSVPPGTRSLAPLTELVGAPSHRCCAIAGFCFCCWCCCCCCCCCSVRAPSSSLGSSEASGGSSEKWSACQSGPSAPPMKEKRAR
mmetsp:Transcript_7424/g.30172  ORF Transcript_7424/g.30172 Transcript_7424/m.30172 type:complete len:275 (+) Transcript_7424:870-1694(+)